ncbi:MAG: hypothetical protein RSA49_01520 [Anaerovoracaceae bacterium]
MKQRLANVKTRTQTGLDYVMNSLEIGTPFGRKILKAKKPFFPGQEENLREELDKIQEVLEFAKANPKIIERINIDIFMCMNDGTGTITRSVTETLSVVELFEIKTLLLFMDSLREYLVNSKLKVDESFIPQDISTLLDELDPRHDRLNTFYLYEEFSPRLAELRTEKRTYEVNLRKEQKAMRDKVKEEYDIFLTPKFEIVVSKHDEMTIDKLTNIEELEIADQDYMSITFALKKTGKAFEISKEIEDINCKIEDEEFAVRQVLSEKIGRYKEVLLDNCNTIGEFDVALAKATFAMERNCVKPIICDEQVLQIKEARHLEVEEVLQRKNKEYVPISITLEQGVTCISGANMGGKTISLKLVGMIVILAQYGFFVPCKDAQIGLSNFMQILIGDSQSVERGLSSFGSEMEELKEILDHGVDRSIILIDEIASGTNPVEGLALTRSLIDYLKTKPYISLITTHFDAVTVDGIKNMQVVGLGNANFDQLDSAIRYANRKKRIEIISEQMDYRLREVKDGAEIPKDALNIAKMLGISEEIIDNAKKYL